MSRKSRVLSSRSFVTNPTYLLKLGVYNHMIELASLIEKSRQWGTTI